MFAYLAHRGRLEKFFTTTQKKNYVIFSFSQNYPTVSAAEEGQLGLIADVTSMIL